MEQNRRNKKKSQRNKKQLRHWGAIRLRWKCDRASREIQNISQRNPKN